MVGACEGGRQQGRLRAWALAIVNSKSLATCQIRLFSYKRGPVVSTGDGRGQAQAGLDLHYIYIRPKKKIPVLRN